MIEDGAQAGGNLGSIDHHLIRPETVGKWMLNDMKKDEKETEIRTEFLLRMLLKIEGSRGGSGGGEGKKCLERREIVHRE